MPTEPKFEPKKDELLLIYEEIPEKTRFFLLKVDGDELSNLVECHNRYINANPGLDARLTEWLTSKLWTSDGEPGPWAKYEYLLKQGSPILIQKPCIIVHTGILL